jgi:DUF971 family protein
LDQPRRIERQPDGNLTILWSDGHQAVYAPRALRLACGCAGCQDEWSGERTLNPDSVPDDVRAEDIKPVGRYGLQFVWSDGHSTGIYTYERLRGLCRCAGCRGTTPP